MHESPLLLPTIIGEPAFVTYSWAAIVFLVVVSFIVRMSIKLIPVGVQNTVEVITEMLLNLSENNIGHNMGRIFFPLIATLGMYILVCNFFGLIPGFESPTSNINTTASMAVPVFLATHYYGLKVHRLSYFKHFLGPIRSLYALPLMILIFFIEVIGHMARPLTLSVRLFGNMIAKHKILLVLGVLAPAIVPTAILGLGVLVSVIQAFVFVLLATLYLAGAVEEAH